MFPFSIILTKTISRNVALLNADKTLLYIQDRYSNLKAKEFRKIDNKLYFKVGLILSKGHIFNSIDGGSVEVNNLQNIINYRFSFIRFHVIFLISAVCMLFIRELWGIKKHEICDFNMTN